MGYGRIVMIENEETSDKIGLIHAIKHKVKELEELLEKEEGMTDNSVTTVASKILANGSSAN